MSCETCKNHEAEYIAEATKGSRLMGDMVQAYDRQNRRLWVTVLALAGTLANHCRVYGLGCYKRAENR